MSRPHERLGHAAIRMRRFLQGYRVCRGSLKSRTLPATLALVGGTARYSTRRTIEGHGGPRRKEEIALRAQRSAASSVALDVLRSSSVLNAFFRSAGIHATNEVPGCLHANGIRRGRVPRSGVGTVGKWPAGATAKSLAQAGHLSTAVVIADLR